MCGGWWWCVEDGVWRIVCTYVEDGVWRMVCGQSSQTCFHAVSIEMDNLTLTRRRSTYEACAHVPPICMPRLPTPMALGLVPKNTKTNSTMNTKRNHHKHASAEDAPRQAPLDTMVLEITPVQIQMRRLSMYRNLDHRIGDATPSQPQSNVRTTLL